MEPKDVNFVFNGESYGPAGGFPFPPDIKVRCMYCFTYLKTTEECGEACMEREDIEIPPSIFDTPSIYRKFTPGLITIRAVCKSCFDKGFRI